MLETVRQYASERLARDSERDTIHQLHLQHYLAVVEAVAPLLSTHHEREALALLERDIHNIYGALRWALETAPTDALRLAGCLGEFWTICPDTDALEWLNSALEGARKVAPPAARARAHLARAYLLRQSAEAYDADRAALELYRQTGDDHGISDALSACAVGALHTGELEHARAYAEAACQHARVADDDALLGKALIRLAMTLPPNQQPEALEQAAHLLAHVGNYRELARGYFSAAYFALRENHAVEALRLLDVALPAAVRAGDRPTQAYVTGNLGLAHLFLGDLAHATEAFERQLRLCIDRAYDDCAAEALAGLAALCPRES